ncbi:MAG: HIT domain-containing protein [Patescibacteria group bacterium]|jgi:histidine triad (HIT) family protein
MSCVLCDVFGGSVSENLIVTRTPELVICYALKRDAPVHILGVPDEHVATIEQAKPGLCGRIIISLIEAYNEMRREGYWADGVNYPGDQLNGYRIVINEGPDGGQSVPGHYHVHLVAGVTMFGLKSDERPVGDHLRSGMYPANMILDTPGDKIDLQMVAPGMWVFIQTDLGVFEFRYHSGLMFYWRQENVHTRFGKLQQMPCVGSTLRVNVLWPQLLPGPDFTVDRDLGTIKAIVFP